MFILPYCNVVFWVLDLCLMCWCAAWFCVKAIPLIISSFVQGDSWGMCPVSKQELIGTGIYSSYTRYKWL